MPADGPGRDDGGGEEAGWAWDLLRLLHNGSGFSIVGRGCCYNITLQDVHGRIASKWGELVAPRSGGRVPDAAQRGAYTCASMIAGRQDAKQLSFRRLRTCLRSAASPGPPQALSGQAPELDVPGLQPIMSVAVIPRTRRNWELAMHDMRHDPAIERCNLEPGLDQEFSARSELKRLKKPPIASRIKPKEDTWVPQAHESAPTVASMIEDDEGA
jgi:hypothetical protein